jgi:hypothetical protein
MMNSLQKIVDQAKQFIFGEYSDWRGVAFFRISLPLILIALSLLTWSQYISIYSSTGYIQRDISEVLINDYLITTYRLTDFLHYCFGLSELSSLYLLRWLYLTFLIFLCVGFLTRFSAFMCWLLHLAFVKSAHNFMYGTDYIHTTMLFFCILLPVGNYFSLDNKIFGRRKENALPSLRVFQIQLCITYFFAGLTKAMGLNWWNGESIWKSLHRPILGDFDFAWLAGYPLLAVSLGVGVILTESLYPIMIWVRPFRINKIWLWLIISMHLSIAFFLDLNIFSATMISFNISAFYFFIHGRSNEMNVNT